MSNAWEVTPEDIGAILKAHDKERNEDSEELFREFFWSQNAHQVEKAVLAYTDFDDQCAAASCEIENILMEEGRVQGPKKFNGPE